jgi:stage V sporulation protein AF
MQKGGGFLSDFAYPYAANLVRVRDALRVKESFDLLEKRIRLGERQAAFFCVDGFIKDEMFEKVLEHFCKLTEKQLKEAPDADAFLDAYVTYIEAQTTDKLDVFVSMVLSGAVGMVADGFDKALILDPRTYPSRAIEEPESDRLLRGPHEGFVETLVCNTALIRRRIRDPQLTVRLWQIGRRSRTDVVVCYLDDKVNRRHLRALEQKLAAIRVDALTLGQESLRECLLPGQIWNPFPRFRYTERPDTAAACLYDGNVIVLVDGTPSALIVPTGIFDFIQDINDYYFTPFIGTFFKFVRGFMFLLSLLFVPTWYVLSLHHTLLPERLWFIFVNHPNGVSIFFQLIVSEFLIDMLRLASLNTPNVLSNSFAVIGALVLGEFGVSSGLFVHEVVMFMAFTSISNFVLPSFELGFSVKYCRMLLLTLTYMFDFWGFFAGLLVIVLVVCFTKTIEGYTYLYPLIPFDKDALVSALFRRRIRVKQNNRRL